MIYFASQSLAVFFPFFVTVVLLSACFLTYSVPDTFICSFCRHSCSSFSLSCLYFLRSVVLYFFPVPLTSHVCSKKWHRHKQLKTDTEFCEVSVQIFRVKDVAPNVPRYEKNRAEQRVCVCVSRNGSVLRVRPLKYLVCNHKHPPPRPPAKCWVRRWARENVWCGAKAA